MKVEQSIGLNEVHADWSAKQFRFTKGRTVETRTFWVWILICLKVFALKTFSMRKDCYYMFTIRENIWLNIIHLKNFIWKKIYFHIRCKKKQYFVLEAHENHVINLGYDWSGHDVLLNLHILSDLAPHVAALIRTVTCANVAKKWRALGSAASATRRISPTTKGRGRCVRAPVSTPPSSWRPEAPGCRRCRRRLEIPAAAAAAAVNTRDDNDGPRLVQLDQPRG